MIKRLHRIKGVYVKITVMIAICRYECLTLSRANRRGSVKYAHGRGQKMAKIFDWMPKTWALPIYEIALRS